MKPAILIFLRSAVLVLGLPGAALAGEPVGTGEFFDVLDVDVVNLEVHVTDRRGRPITGLTREDFEVFEDGRPMVLTNFAAYFEEDSEAAEREGDRPRPRLPGRPGDDTDATSPDQRLYLIVYIDNFNIRPFNRNRVFRRLREFLHQHMRDGDRVMLVTYDRSFNERVPFTSDPSLISSALFDLERLSGHGVHQDSERRDVLEFIENARSVTDATIRARSYAGSLHNDLIFTIDAMRDLVNDLGGLPGRKALLYVSDGLPMTPAEDIYIAIHEKFKTSSVLMEARDFDASRRFQELAAQANTNRVTFYTIDAGGLRTYAVASIDRISPAISTFVDSQHIHNIQSPLLRLADATGGRAVINTNDVGPDLEEIGRELRSYYSLGYQPVHVVKGRYHRVEVRVKHRGARVRHREGYRSRSADQRMEEGILAALRFGEQANPGGIEVHFGDVQRRSDGHFLVPIQVRIPLDRVTLLPLGEGDTHRARLKVFLAALDAEGGISPVQSAPIPIEVPGKDLDAARASAWAYEMTLLMRQGPHRIAVGLRDELGAESSFLSRGLRVGS
jgi:VWFA-related protein